MIRFRAEANRVLVESINFEYWADSWRGLIWPLSTQKSILSFFFFFEISFDLQTSAPHRSFTYRHRLLRNDTWRAEPTLGARKNPRNAGCPTRPSPFRAPITIPTPDSECTRRRYLESTYHSPRSELDGKVAEKNYSSLFATARFIIHARVTIHRQTPENQNIPQQQVLTWRSNDALTGQLTKKLTTCNSS